MPEHMIDYIAALTGLLAIIVSLASALSAARRSAFEDLQKVVKALQHQLGEETRKREKLETELADEKKKRQELEVQVAAEQKLRQRLSEQLGAEQKRRERIERWARALVHQLREKKIKPVPFVAVE